MPTRVGSGRLTRRRARTEAQAPAEVRGLATARKRDDALLTVWQVYRMFDARRGAWSTFQFLIKERLEDDGKSVGSDGRLTR